MSETALKELATDLVEDAVAQLKHGVEEEGTKAYRALAEAARKLAISAETLSVSAIRFARDREKGLISDLQRHRIASALISTGMLAFLAGLLLRRR